MKVAIVVPSLEVVGPVKVAFDIVSSLCKEIDVTVYYLKKSSGLQFPCRTKKLTWRNLLELYRFDVLHSHMLRPDLLIAALPFFKGRKISTIHNMVREDIYYTHGEKISVLATQAWLLLWKRFHHIVVLSNVAKEYYVKLKLSKQKIVVIHNGIRMLSTEGCLEQKEKTLIDSFVQGRKTLGSVCLFNRRKGLEQIVRVLPLLKTFCFLVVGDGPIKRELQNLAESLGVADRILFLGFRDNARDYIHYFDIYVMPSRSEGFGLAMMEAVAAKKTIVCSDIPIFKELFSEDEISFFSIDNMNSLSSTILNAIERKSELVNNAHATFLRRYTSDVMASKYLALYAYQG